MVRCCHVACSETEGLAAAGCDAACLLFSSPIWPSKPTPVAMPAHRRALLFMHHILSSKKKDFIGDEARALGVSGWCKVGHPGVLVVQGTDGQVTEYVKKIKVRVMAAFFLFYCVLICGGSGYDGRVVW